MELHSHLEEGLVGSGLAADMVGIGGRHHHNRNFDRSLLLLDRTAVAVDNLLEIDTPHMIVVDFDDNHLVDTLLHTSVLRHRLRYLLRRDDSDQYR